MPRRARAIAGGMAYHVLNRAVGRQVLFDGSGDYKAFEQVLEQAHRRDPLRILAYCIMPNHWHLVVWPDPGRDDQLSSFMHWLTMTHTQRWHAFHGTTGTGPLYQGRFKAFPIQTDEHLWTVIRYVERNPLRAGLVPRCEAWQWSSLWRWAHGGRENDRQLGAWPLTAGGRPTNWLELVNQAQTEAELQAIRASISRNRPFGSREWTTRIAANLGLECAIRPRGRPRRATAHA